VFCQECQAQATIEKQQLGKKGRTKRKGLSPVCQAQATSEKQQNRGQKRKSLSPVDKDDHHPDLILNENMVTKFPMTKDGYCGYEAFGRFVKKALTGSSNLWEYLADM
jgi:hypothetical protein